MEPNALTRLKRVAGKQTTILTHYGRKTGKPHEVTIWFVLWEGALRSGNPRSLSILIRAVMRC